MRRSEVKRETAETKVELSLELDGSGRADVKTGVGFLDHMLTLLALHGGFDLAVSCRGDLEVDGHHSVEDIGLCLGAAILQALGNKRGINRYGNIILPMDEALILCAVDLSGRPCLRYTAEIPSEKVGDFDTELAREFFQAVANTGLMSLHIRQLDGINSHHIIEGMFKALGRALRQAVQVTGGALPSTKGVL
ncbi:MAG TPA: imidazoleglycerol-phosphate dehydratase HisB [Candidatus Scatomorpha pullistercoris]|uniref:Imidazoleglycerol-phosphate dehydratase n=1 Tax=Candidatus Scatomorpha pullistercoris TaxID=2840929 RepID=A0A9D1G567_9FIRM|nr:imidazoleglycerol-phosphate dehydratase HisB [Candidatus Scatomorpha pullistercoris]